MSSIDREAVFSHALVKVPWYPLESGGTKYLIKFLFSSNTYAMMITDFLDVWGCFADSDRISAERELFNPQLEMEQDQLLGMIGSKFQEKFAPSLVDSSAEENELVSVQRPRSVDITVLNLKLKFQFFVCDFVWAFSMECMQKKTSGILLRDQLTLPLLFTAHSLSSRVERLK